MKTVAFVEVLPEVPLPRQVVRALVADTRLLSPLVGASSTSWRSAFWW